MKNWAGFNLQLGDYVWRGARDGDRSSFKIGRIVDFNEEKKKAKVHYFVEQAYGSVSKKKSHGWTTIDALAKIDADQIDLDALLWDD